MDNLLPERSNTIIFQIKAMEANQTMASEKFLVLYSYEPCTFDVLGTLVISC